MPFADDPAPPDIQSLRSVSGRTGRGWLVPIGGRLHTPEILARFIDLCGGTDARIAIIPTASNEADCAAYYEWVFTPYRQRSTVVLSLATRADASKPDVLAQIGDATGVFFTGGNQLKLATVLGGTPLAALIRQRFHAGLPVGGTSAGAAFLSDHMIAFGEEGSVPRAAMVTTVAGLGLTERFIIDQHFRERDRLGRLVTAIAYNPIMMGVGIDEDTAAFIGPDDELHVVGTGSVTIVDPAQLDSSEILDAIPGTPLDVPGMAVHVLTAGAVYDTFTSLPSSAGPIASSARAGARPS